MKKALILSSITLLMALTAAIAGAADLAGKVSVTGRIGFLVPADSESTDRGSININTDVGVVGGGGFLYGIDKHWAAELDITATGYSGDTSGRSGDFGIVDVALGGQYRFKEISKFTPYLGAGIDILLNDAELSGHNADVDTVLGVHFAGGVDYFLAKNLALTSEMKFILSPTADMNYGGKKVGNFDPSSFSMTFGVRYFIN